MGSTSQKVKKVAVAGATGSLGSHIVSALANAGTYDITVLVRRGSAPAIPHAVTTVEVDYDSDDSLRSVLQGHDVLVSALGKTALAFQPRLIEAAAAVGVHRIIPSEFGGNTVNPKTRQFPTYRPKVVVQEQLERLRKQLGISYTIIITNCLLDWGLSNIGQMLMQPAARTIRLYDGGDIKFSTTSMPTAAKAVVGVLDRYDETANRAVFIHDIVTTQNELLEIAKEVTAGDGGKEWEASVVDTAELETQAYAALKKSGPGLAEFYAFAARGAFGHGYGGCFLENDNELLGIKEMDQQQLRELVRDIILRDSRVPTF